MTFKQVRLAALAATLLAGTATFAYAQSGSSSMGAGGSSAKHGESPSSMGTGAPTAGKTDASPAASGGSSAKAGDANKDKSAEKKGEKNDKSAQGAKGVDKTAQDKASDKKSASDKAASDKTEKGKTSTAGTGDSKAASSPNKADAKSANSTSGKGEAGGSVNLTAQQKTTIKNTVINNKSAPRVTSVNFSVSVGTVVPTTVHFAPLPASIIEIHPAWRGYDYFVYEEEVIIIEPHSHKIVEIIVVS